jgi:hypothetical protein
MTKHAQRLRYPGTLFFTTVAFQGCDHGVIGFVIGNADDKHEVLCVWTDGIAARSRHVMPGFTTIAWEPESE